MLCWLQDKILPMARALGRSEKREPFWIRAWWARVLSAMKMTRWEPIGRVTMGPYLVWRFRRIGSSSEKVFRSHRKLVMTGMLGGPGGVVMVLL